MSWLLDIAASLSIPAGGALALPIVAAWERRNGALDRPLRWAASLAIFLGFLQVGGMLLGFTGLLHGFSVVGWLTLGAAVCAAFAWKGRASLRLPTLRRPSAPALVGGLILLLYLVQATVPPWYRDSLVYHLALPRLFAMAGGYVQPDDNVFASFPLGWESILAMLHALGSSADRFPPFNPRLVGVWTIGGAALSVTALAQTLGASRRIAPWAGVLFLLIPTVFEFGTSAYVESWLLLLSILSLTGILRVIAGDGASLLPAAALAGLAASVKYPGLALCTFLALLLLGSGLRRRPEESALALRQTLVFSAIAAVVGAPFYLRNLLERGNPVFPLAFDRFGGPGWDEWRDLAYGITLANYGQGRDLVDYLLLPWRLFTATSMRTGFEGSLGPMLGLGLVAAFVLARDRSASLRRLHVGALIFVLLWSGFWALTVQQARFYLLGVPALLAALLVFVDRWPPRRKNAALLALVLGAAAWFAPPATDLWRRQQTGPWLAGKASEAEILSALLPDSYPPMRELEALVPEDGKVWLVWMRGYTYYLRRPYRLDSVFEAYRLEALLDETPDPVEVVNALHADGITHLLVHGAFFLWEDNADLRPGRTEQIRERFDRLRALGALRAIHQWGEVSLYEVGARNSSRLASPSGI